MTEIPRLSELFARPISRRRMLGVVAVACTAPLLTESRRTVRSVEPPAFTWHGTALGAPGRITICHADSGRARDVLAHCLNELARLERSFSLYDPTSELSRLNDTGNLGGASLDLRLVLDEARRLGVVTGGAFDVTVQPIWRLYADHFSVPGSDPAGPPPEAIAARRRLVDYRAIDLAGASVRFARPGMAVTLNGIAQGYIDDRLCDLLCNEGVDRALIDLGEIRGLTGDEGRRWAIGIAQPGRRDGLAAKIMLGNGALATSSGRALPFDAEGRHHHLLDPLTGRSMTPHRSVSVVSPRATLSDALSTALSLLPAARAPGILAAAGASRALIVGHDGTAIWHDPV